MTYSPSRRTALKSLAAATAFATLLSACAGEGSGSANASGVAGGGSQNTVTIDYATYNPLSLIIRKKGWLETALAAEGKKVEWVKSAGSNKANEALRSGNIDVGSTAGSAALLARANGSPIKVISLYSQPEWSALVTRKDSGITKVADLKGKTVAVTKGTDPYFLLLQALKQEGISASDLTIQNLQHADGRTALDNGQVNAWSGLDPIRRGGKRRCALLPQPKLQHLRLPERDREVHSVQPDRRTDYRGRVRVRSRLG